MALVATGQSWTRLHVDLGGCGVGLQLDVEIADAEVSVLIDDIVMM
jgi:hypothetical protein